MWETGVSDTNDDNIDNDGARNRHEEASTQPQSYLDVRLCTAGKEVHRWSHILSPTRGDDVDYRNVRIEIRLEKVDAESAQAPVTR